MLVFFADGIAYLLVYEIVPGGYCKCLSKFTTISFMPLIEKNHI